MLSIPFQIVRDFLHEAGYRVLFRKRGWSECLVFSGQERWIGREATEELALHDALRQMFPSGTAREILERTLSRWVQQALQEERRIPRTAPVTLGSLVSEPIPAAQRSEAMGPPLSEPVPAAKPSEPTGPALSERSPVAGRSEAMGPPLSERIPGAKRSEAMGPPLSERIPAARPSEAMGPPLSERIPVAKPSDSMIPLVTRGIPAAKPSEGMIPLVTKEIPAAKPSEAASTPVSKGRPAAKSSGGGSAPSSKGIPPAKSSEGVLFYGPRSATKFPDPVGSSPGKPSLSPSVPASPEGSAAPLENHSIPSESRKGSISAPSWRAVRSTAPPAPSALGLLGADGFGTIPTLRQEQGALPILDRKSPLRVKGAIHAIESLVGGLDAEDKRLASMSPQRLRLWALYWICHARSYEETFPDESEVARAVARVAKRLTDLCKRYWPGKIRALQLHARPSESGVGGTVATWREAEATARRQLDEHLKHGMEIGLDASGWADATALLPSPPAPQAMLVEITDVIQRITGPLEAPREFVSPPTDEALEGLVVVAQKLRWLRGAVDCERWGLLMGRLRWFAQELGSRGARIKSLIDPLHQPATPWAALFPTNGEISHQVEAVTDLLHGRPGPGTDREALAAWIVRALDVLDTAQIATVLTPIRSEVRDLDPAALPAPGRRVRRRFRDLIARLPNADERSDPPPSTLGIDAPPAPLSQWSSTLLGDEPPTNVGHPEPSRGPTSVSDPLPPEWRPGSRPSD